jgi:hypothetical protein
MITLIAYPYSNDTFEFVELGNMIGITTEALKTVLVSKYKEELRKNGWTIVKYSFRNNQLQIYASHKDQKDQKKLRKLGFELEPVEFNTIL